MKKENWKTATDDFGADFKPLPIAESYYPSRYEYFLGKILTGLLTGRSEKYNRVAIRSAMTLADELEEALNDKAQD